jgi:hypothetical protein
VNAVAAFAWGLPPTHAFDADVGRGDLQYGKSHVRGTYFVYPVTTAANRLFVRTDGACCKQPSRRASPRVACRQRAPPARPAAGIPHADKEIPQPSAQGRRQRPDGNVAVPLPLAPSLRTILSIDHGLSPSRRRSHRGVALNSFDEEVPS